MKRRVARHAVTQPLDPSYKLIALTQGQNAIVDTADFEWLNQWNWNADWNASARTFYVRRRGGFRMHRFILGVTNPAIDVDHRNENGLDNRRSNLRRCDRIRNMQNQGLRSNNTSGFKGVTWYPHRGMNKWVAKITIEKRQISLGYFDTAEQAAHGYDKAAQEHFGAFAQLNFPTPFHSKHLINRFSLVL